MKRFLGLRLSWIIGGLGKARFSSLGRAGRTCQNLPLNGRLAFTLAEVLITLGIIGVVAALTMPALIADYKEKVFVNSAKRSYSIILNAINKWNADNGIVGEYLSFWTSGSTNLELLNSLTKELNVVSVCDSSNMNSCGGKHIVRQYKKLNDGYGNTKTEKWFDENRAVLSDGSFISVQSEIQNGGCSHTFYLKETDADGNFIPDSSSPGGYKGRYSISANCGFVSVDTNGLKGPNTVGIDCFQIGSSEQGGNYTTDPKRGNLNYILSNNKLINTEKYTIGEY